MNRPTVLCLGWGSLVWDQRELRTAGGWNSDGPHLPVEFARASDGGAGRLTLVVLPGALPVPVLWAQLDYDDVASAVEALRAREGCAKASIGVWTPSALPCDESSQAVGRWALGRGADAVLWTALPPLFNGERGVAPSSADAAVAYLRSRPADVLRSAEQYVRLAPAQIRTSFRAAFETQLGWTPLP